MTLMNEPSCIDSVMKSQPSGQLQNARVSEYANLLDELSMGWLLIKLLCTHCSLYVVEIFIYSGPTRFVIF